MKIIKFQYTIGGTIFSGKILANSILEAIHELSKQCDTNFLTKIEITDNE